MKTLKIIIQIALLYIFYMVGNWISAQLHLPIPGSIVGVVLLLAALIIGICPVHWVETGSGFLLAYLPLLFIPATVGVMNYFHLFAGSGILLIVIIVVSTLFTMITAGHTSQFLAKRSAKRKEKKQCSKYLSQSS
ncbi:CidA/LrgA family protein [Halobacillus hunanensis]|uniref:CidA/LrgA family protein n=1 Tax=Halobacillus hunanensis TaxID=578214 RepID=UPI0009A72774|nr:CidA/LrgA family protein [Halobacillus hunanensis]